MIRYRLEALLLACAVSAVSGACQSGSFAPKGANGERSPVAAPRPVVSITAVPPSAPRARDPVRASCGLTTPEPVELMPVLHGKVVVRRNLAAVKLIGRPRIIHEPEDFSEYYLAESDVELASLPVSLKSLFGASLDVLGGPEDCRPKLGKISAWAWADEEGLGWKHGVPSYNARRAFRDGEAFLVAELGSECDFTYGGLVTRSRLEGYRPWETRELAEEPEGTGGPERNTLVEKGRAALEREPGLAVQNAAYERFVEAHRLALPKRWWELPRAYVRWTQATLAASSLLIVELDARADDGADTFDGSWLGVWCVETDGELVSLGPDLIPAEHAREITSYRHHLEVFGREGELPLVLYRYFGLEPSSGRYAHWDFAMGPAPHIDEPEAP